MFDEAQTTTYEMHPELAQAIAPHPQMQQYQPQQEVVQQAPEQIMEQQPQYAQVAQETAHQVANEAEINYRKVRAETARLQRERDEAIRMLQEERMAKQYQPQQQQQTNQNLTIGDEDIVEGKHLKQLQNQNYQQQQEFLKIQQKQYAAIQESKLKMEMPDFDKVVTQENIDELKYRHPEIANAIGSSSDLYTQGKSAYEIIKNMGIYKQDNFVADRLKAQANAAKPRPLTSSSPQQGDSPLSHANAFANGLTDELKSQLYKEMQQAMRMGR